MKAFQTKPVAILSLALLAPALLSAQVTHGKKPTLPAPFSSKSSAKPSEDVQPPAGFLPKAPQGFAVNVFASNFKEPRWLATAPNGDIFLAESGAGRVVILRDSNHSGSSQQTEVFANKLNKPFGILFHDDYVYVADTDSLLRFKYDAHTSKRTGDPEKLMDLPRGGHWTRAVALAPDGKHLFVSIGSDSNVSIEKDSRRAAVTICDLDGKNARLYATGLRNPVGIATEPSTGALWTSVNERDGMGDDLPPDYLTSVKDGGFYGWPYSYIGDNLDSRVSPQKPELVAKAIIPDILLGAHRAPLQFTFYNGTQFPAQYRSGIFLAEHGSWNRSVLAGYQIVFVPFEQGQPSGDPIAFLTGFVPDPSKSSVYGRPVGVTVAQDGSLLVSDDSAGVVYRVSAQ